MKTFTCRCGGTLYFGNPVCVACHSTLWLCDHCNQLAAVDPSPSENGDFIEASCSVCQHPIRRCENQDHGVCLGSQVIQSDDLSESLCRYCRLNHTIPPLTQAGNLEKWRRLEAAKRRVLHDMTSQGLPLTDQDLPLSFAFLESTSEHVVSTGHSNGRITINIAEADSIYRESVRVQFGEPQRTLVGHFRHELGHYYWQLIVRPRMIEAFRSSFGDERKPDYASAQETYYRDGPANQWSSRFVSAYASMHPWEDFAETFAMYFDIVAIISTARDFSRVRVAATLSQFDRMVKAFIEIGLVANEMNRDLGLLDLVPEVFNDTVIEKLRFIDQMTRLVSSRH